MKVFDYYSNDTVQIGIKMLRKKTFTQQVLDCGS